MNYIGHPETFCKTKYEDNMSIGLFGENEVVFRGEAGIHNKYLYLCEKKASLYVSYCFVCSQLRKTVSEVVNSQPDIRLFPATQCLYIYLCPPNGLLSDYTRREWVDIDSMLVNKRNNSMYDHYKENKRKAEMAIKGAISKDNSDIYIALSPDRTWTGSSYMADYDNYSEKAAILMNISAYGAFNSAEATMTLHAHYDRNTGNVQGEVNYYIVDYYDFDVDKYKLLFELNALGLACGYELYGIHKDVIDMAV